MERLLRSRDLEAVWKYASSVLRGRKGSSEEELPLLLRVAVLAAQYGEERRALQWIDRHQARGSSSELSAAYDAIRVAVHLAVKNHSSAERRARTIDWRLVPASPWAWNVRLLLAARSNDSREVLRLLRRPCPEHPSPPELREPYDRGNRLRILGLHFFGQGHWDRGMGFFRAALREFSRDAGVDARLKGVEILGASGMAAYHGGRLEDAEALLSSAIDEARGLHHHFYRDKFRHELALVWSEREEFARAEELLLQVAAEAEKRSPSTAADHFLQAGALLAAADLAVENRDGERTARLLSRAGRLLDERDHPRYRGHLHLCRGRLEALSPLNDASSRAFEHLDLAEGYFRSLGDGDLVGTAQVRLHRSRLHLRLREPRGALSEANECASAARLARFQPVQAACLLLKSRLLLEEHVPRPQALYEDVLGNLAVVRAPTRLFKVVANLYLYSWELDGHLEWTDYHMQQILQIRTLLDEATFRHLYDAHVVRRVARRFLARNLGIHPSALEDPEP